VTVATASVRAAARRGAPPRRQLVRAVVAGAVAQLAGVALLGGAAALLVWSAHRPGLGAVAGLLLVVELLAFARAPLRHLERVTAHDLGLGGLEGWRTWLLDSVATWSPSRMAAARAGDLLSRCLEDTDRLQDIWVRAAVPAMATLLALAAASVGLTVAEPLAGLGVAVASAVVALATWGRAGRVSRLGTEEAELRGAAAAHAVELAQGAEALRLLGADRAHLAATASLVARADVLAGRREATSARLGLLAAGAAGAALIAAVTGATLPTTNAALAAGVALATLACGDLLATLPLALEPLGPVAGAATRLAGLASERATGTEPAEPGALELADVDVAPAEVGPVLLAHVSLAVAPDALVCVTGPTGSGKSALLAVAAALEPPRAGAVRLAGRDVAAIEEGALRGVLQWLPAHPGLLEGRVRDVLDVGRGLDDETLHAVIERVGLADVLAGRGGLDAVVGGAGTGLSGGEQRLLALARLLAGSPRVLVLDEPTAGLDERAAAKVRDAVAAAGAAVLAASHDEAVLAWATTAHRVVEGRVEPA